MLDEVEPLALAPARGDAPALVSVLLVNWNTIETTLRCLDSLALGMDADLRTEVIVVDNGSRDGSAALLAVREDITFLANRRNLGFAAAVNQAYGHATGDLILLLNSDIEFTPRSLARLVGFLRERSDVAGVAPVYLNPDGSPQQHHFRLPTVATVLASSSAIVRRIPPFGNRLRDYLFDQGGIRVAQRVPQPSASCLLLRRDALPPDRIFDERYPIFFNDVQLAVDLAADGHELWVTPDVEVLHEGHASTRLLGGSLRRQYIGTQVLYLKENHSPYAVWLYRSLALLSGGASYLLRRPDALAPGDLWRALAGDPGPLPEAPEAPTNGAARET